MSRDPAYLAEIRPGWRRNWLESIAEFADHDLQRRSWFGGPEYSSPYWSFVEWMCRYFDDYSLSSGYSQFIEEGLVSPEEAEAVSSFHAAADAYKAPDGNDYNHSAILSEFLRFRGFEANVILDAEPAIPIAFVVTNATSGTVLNFRKHMIDMPRSQLVSKSR